MKALTVEVLAAETLRVLGDELKGRETTLTEERCEKVVELAFPSEMLMDTLDHVSSIGIRPAIAEWVSRTGGKPIKFWIYRPKDIPHVTLVDEVKKISVCGGFNIRKLEVAVTIGYTLMEQEQEMRPCPTNQT